MSCCFTSLLIIIWKCLVVFVMSLLLLTIEINSDLEQLSVFFLDIRLGRKDIKSWILLLKNFCSKNVIFHEDIFPYTTDSNNSFFFFSPIASIYNPNVSFIDDLDYIPSCSSPVLSQIVPSDIVSSPVSIISESIQFFDNCITKSQHHYA